MAPQPCASHAPWRQCARVLGMGGVLAFAVVACAACGGGDDAGERARPGVGLRTGGGCGTVASSECTPHVGPKGTIQVHSTRWRILSARAARTLAKRGFGGGLNPDGVFVLVKVRGRNLAGESAALSADDFKLSHLDGSEYPVDQQAAVAAVVNGEDGSAPQAVL